MQSEQSTQLNQVKKSSSKKDKVQPQVTLSTTESQEPVVTKSASKQTKSKKGSASVVTEQVQESAPVVTEQVQESAPVVSEQVQESTPAITQQVQESTPVVTEQVQESVTEPSSVSVVLQDTETFLEFMNVTSDKFTEFSKFFKESSFTKDERNKVDTGFKKLFKAVAVFQNSYLDNLSKQVSLLEKSSGHKAGSVKKVQSKEKSAIHKKLNVQPFLLKFMSLEPGTTVSRSDALTSITGYVAKEKLTNPNIIVENDKRSFKLIGDLKGLFNGIEGVMKSKGLLETSQFPTQIKYTQIMQYMTHCFIKTDNVTVV
jgi:hypothetical protein